MNNKIKQYSDIIPKDLKFIIKCLNEPKDDLDWSLISYIFKNSGIGIITLGKISAYFSLDKSVVQKRLNRLSGFWFSQYLNKQYKVYYTYEMNNFSAEILIDIMNILNKSFVSK